jgi:hypothetical protein
MPIVAKASGSSIEPIPAGPHHAICIGVVDLGTQQPTNPQFRASRKVAIIWEIPDERIKIERDGKQLDLPRSINRTFGLSLGPKAELRKFLENWRAKPFTDEELKGFDLKNLLGVNCQINVVQEAKGDKTYSNVTAASPLMKGLPKKTAENPPLYFTLEDCPAGEVKFPSHMPEWLQARVMNSDEYIARAQQANPQHAATADVGDVVSEDVPF